MSPTQRKRLRLILWLFISSCLIVGLILYVFSQNLNAFYTTEELETAFLNNPKIDCLGTTMNGEKFKKMFGVKFDNLTRITPKMVLLKNFLCIQTTMIKKNVIKDIGYFYENQFNEDSNIIIRIANKYNCYLLNESYVIYIPNASGVSSRMWKMEKGELQNIKMALKMKVIKPIEFPFFVGFSLAKFCRRVIVNSFKKTCKK